jgi:hypothetical protein
MNFLNPATGVARVLKYRVDPLRRDPWSRLGSTNLSVATQPNETLPQFDIQDAVEKDLINSIA